jgi:3-oxoacyl-[acyl-carrier protein] reductase
MNLGIAGKTAIVCAASKGLGRASAMALAREGVNLTVNARSADALEETAAAIRKETGAQVTAVACDITTPEGRAEVLAACPDPDILVTNAGGPPRGDFRDFGVEDWQAAVNGNMITPIELIKATVDGMIERRFGRIVNITSAAVKSPVDDLCLSNGARCGLTGFIAGLSRTTVRHNVVINNLLPGPFATDRLRSGMAQRAELAGRTFDDVWNGAAAANPAGRFGDPDEFGAACAFLCSAHVGFMTGQQVMLDGGAYNGTF